MNTEDIIKKVQYITVDSQFIGDCNNVFTVNYGASSTATYTANTNAIITNVYNGSNVFIQEIRNVIGVKLVDFYVTQIGTSDAGGQQSAKYIDIICNDIPDAGQILDERKSRVFARVPLERDFSGSSNIIVNDKQWKSFNRQTNYFNPMSIKKLNFQMWEMVGGATGTTGNYQLLQPDAAFYMILEITTIDNTVITLPKEDPTVKVVEAIQSLSAKFDTLLETIPDAFQAPIVNVTTPDVVLPPEMMKTSLSDDDKKKFYIIAFIVLIIAYFLFKK
jgi:hypothetical protein